MMNKFSNVITKPFVYKFGEICLFNKSRETCVVNTTSIIKMNVSKKLFCIFDEDYPYKLLIEYSCNKNVVRTVPVIIGPIILNTTIIDTQDSDTLEIRFKSEEHAEFEVIEINKLQEKKY